MWASVSGMIGVLSSRTSRRIPRIASRMRKTSITTHARPTSTKMACPMIPMAWSMTPLSKERRRQPLPLGYLRPDCDL
jgi:hypothetical protein